MKERGISFVRCMDQRYDCIMVLDIVSILIGFLCGLVITGLLLGFRLLSMEKEKARLEQQVAAMPETFDSVAQESLRKAHEQFLLLAQEKMNQAQSDHNHEVDKKHKAIETLVNPIGQSLKDMDEKIRHLEKTGSGLEGQLKSFAEDQRLLRQETQNLIHALRNPAARGKWGEMQLQRALEMIGMVEGTHFVQQQVAMAEGVRRKPDFIIKLPGGMDIVIDVKTPIEPYWDMLENAENEAEQHQALKKFKDHLRGHLKELSAKEYWRQFDSPEFVVMFLPTEGLYSMAVSNDPALLEDAVKHNIILASPTTVMGLLRVAMHGWQQQQMAEEAKTVATLATELYKRISTFGEHMQKLGRNLGTSINAYNSAVGSLETSVLPGARKLKELHVQTGSKTIDELNMLDVTPRGLTAQELLGDNESNETRKRA